MWQTGFLAPTSQLGRLLSNGKPDGEQFDFPDRGGIGLLPRYGVTFLADRIDNITYIMSDFANETITDFKLLAENDKFHRLTLLKHEMALDFLMAKTGGLCVTLNLTEDACLTMIPENADNTTSVIAALGKIRDAFGSSRSAGFSFGVWLTGKLGTWGAMMVQVLIPVTIVFGVALCFCTCALTCMKTLLHHWIDGIVGQRYRRYLRLNATDPSEGKESDLDPFPIPGWDPPFN